MHRSILRIFPALILLFVFSINGVPLDGIVAVVDKDVILLSELNEITRLTLVQANKAIDTSLFNEMRANVLDRIIDDRVLLAKAKTDSIDVSDDEVKTVLQQQIDDLAKRAGSIDALDNELKEKYGLSVAKLKKQYTKDIKENMLKQRFRDKLFQKASVTREEVVDFYNNYKDSIPPEEASVNLSHIVIYVTASKEAEDKAKRKIDDIKGKLDKGASFEKVAYDFSEDPSAKDSGDIGFFQKGAIGLPEFETAAFALQNGEISMPVRSKIGYHIIKMVEHKDQKVHVRHILVLISPQKDVVEKITAKLDSLAYVIKDSISFADAAKQFSEDENTRNKGGYLGWFTRDRLSRDYLDAIKALKESEISKPIRVENAVHIFRVNQATEKRSLTIDEDFMAIQRMALSENVRKKLEKKLREWRSEFYIENHLSELEN